MRNALLIGAALWTLSCSGEFPSGGTGTPGPHRCGDDLDCADTRICVDGTCVFPDEGTGGDCIQATATCGCDGMGFTGALSYLAFKVCGGSESMEITRRGGGARVSWRSAGEACAGALQDCEVEGLGRLLDEAFTGCDGVEPASPCDAPGAVAYLMACHDADGDRCRLLPIGGNACGENELLAGFQQVRQRVRTDPESACD